MTALDIWNYLTELLSGGGDWPLHVFFVVLATLVAGTAVRTLIGKLSQKSRSTDNVVDDAFFDSLVTPARGLVLLLGLSSAAHIAGHSDSIIFESIGSIRNVGIVLMLTWFIQRFIRCYVDLYIKSKTEKGEHVDTTLVLGIGKLFRGTVAITAALIVLQNLGVNISGLLAFGGVGGIAIGLAAQDICKNMFGGFTIYFDRHFAVGDEGNECFAEREHVSIVSSDSRCIVVRVCNSALDFYVCSAHAPFLQSTTDFKKWWDSFTRIIETHCRFGKPVVMALMPTARCLLPSSSTNGV